MSKERQEEPKSREEVYFTTAVFDALQEYVNAQDRETVPRKAFLDISRLAYDKFGERVTGDHEHVWYQHVKTGQFKCFVCGVEQSENPFKGEAPKPDLKQTIIDGQRVRLSQLHDACQWCVNQLAPFENMEAMGPFESFKLRGIAKMLSGEDSGKILDLQKVSGEAKTPDLQLPSVKKRLTFDDKTGEVIVAGPTLIEKLKEDLQNIDKLFKPEDRERCIEIIHRVIEQLESEEKKLTHGSVPTPSDELSEHEFNKAVREYDDTEGHKSQLSFADGIRWHIKWLRSRLSPEQEKKQKS